VYPSEGPAALGAAITGIMVLYLFAQLFGREMLDAAHAYEDDDDPGFLRLLVGMTMAIIMGMWAGWVALGG